MPGAYADAPTLVGRERELAALRASLDAALAGRGGLVLIGGAAGIGKTALAESLCREAAAGSALVLVGRCYDLTETPPYGPWVELFGRAPRGADDPPLPDAFAARGTVGAATSQSVLLQQSLDYFAALAAARPLVLLLDDLHWADPASLDLLRFLARAIADLPVLLIATYRSDELTRRHPLYQLLPAIVRESGAERLDLRTLDGAAIRALVAARYHLPDSETDRLADYLHDRTEGNALFIGEVLRALEEEGALRRHNGGWLMGDLAGIAVPALLRQVIDGRLARLSEQAQRLLAIAAVIGQEVPYDLWAAVSRVDEEVLLSTVAEAGASRIVAEKAGGEAAGFAHALIREAIYEGIRPSQRRRLHLLVGEALAQLPAADPDAIATQFQQAGDARAAEWLIRAGERAQRAYAWAAATDRYERALRLLGADGDRRTRARLLYQVARLNRFFDPVQGVANCEEAERLAREAGDPALVAVARFSRGHCRWYAATDFETTIRELREGADLLAALPPREQALLGCPPNDDGTPTITLCHGQVLQALETRGRLHEAVAFADTYAPVTAHPLSLGELGRSHYGDREQALAHIYAMLGQPDAARGAATRACRAHQDAGHYANLGAMSFMDLIMITLIYFTDDVVGRRRLAAAGEEAWRVASAGTGVSPQFAWTPVLFLDGSWKDARALALAEARSGLLYQCEWAMVTLGPLARACGEPEFVWPFIQRILPAGPATSADNVDFTDMLRTQRLAAALSLDASDAALTAEWLTAHDRWLAWSGAILGWSESHLLWAQYFREIGDMQQAWRHAAKALSRATEPRQPLALLAAHRLLGELDTAASRHADALEHLASALALADACATPYERALTLLAYAELYAAMGRRAEAIAALDAARAICEPLGAKPALTRAAMLATRLATGAGAPPIYPAGLSAREVEVFRLVAAGKTNRDIADALFLSEHTVRVHVRNILTKTRTENRTAAAAFARAHDLA